MDEYISREEVLETIRYRVCQGQGNKEHICKRGSCAYCGIMEIMSDISSIEAADVEPVKHGKWISHGGNSYECSNCHKMIYNAKDMREHAFCGTCGSKNGR